MIDKLIDTPDRRELIRDQISGILYAELANQRVLASSAGKPTDKWDIRVFTEAASPVEEYLQPESDKRARINVSFEDANNRNSSDNNEDYRSTYVINCYACGTAKGTFPADYNAKVRVGEVATIVRSIMRAPEYRTLGLDGTEVWDRNVISIESKKFQDPNAAQNIAAIEITLEVMHTELPPINNWPTIETINIETTIENEIIKATFNY